MNSQENEPSVTLSLTVKDGSAALDFYTRAFGAKELFRMPAPDGSIAHAELMIGNTRVALSEGYPEWQAAPMPEGGIASCLFSLNRESCDEAYTQAIAAGAECLSEPQDQFWGMRTAIVRDPDGYRWNLRHMVEEVSPEEMMRRAQELFGGA